MLRATTTGIPRSISSSVNSRLLERSEASITFIMTSISFLIMYLRVSSSARSCVEREYVPGRSTTSMTFPPMLTRLSVNVTVVPGRLEVFALNPATTLKSVLFPELGCPKSAILRIAHLTG